MAIRGLELFGQHFNAYRQQYVMIGGVASWITMDEAGGEFRATKDLDIVLVIEALNAEFVAHFWEFIKTGGYQIKQIGGDRPVFYRFQNPADEAYPVQIELFSRAPEGLEHPETSTLTRLPTDESVSSLSAILLDEVYYAFLLEGRQMAGGITHIGADRLIPFKAKAWLDLSARKEAGERVDSKNIRKHRNDVLQLSGMLSDDPVGLPDSIRADMTQFLERLRREEVSLRDLGLKGSLEAIIERLAEGFGLQTAAA
ncbi:hypothetical protein NG726_04290 [Pseudomonas sp. MOB-449]|nr:hypothetical protein [Pseudomonas sp. MOB-449]